MTGSNDQTERFSRGLDFLRSSPGIKATFTLRQKGSRIFPEDQQAETLNRILEHPDDSVSVFEAKFLQFRDHAQAQGIKIEQVDQKLTLEA